MVPVHLVGQMAHAEGIDSGHGQRTWTEGMGRGQGHRAWAESKAIEHE